MFLSSLLLQVQLLRNFSDFRFFFKIKILFAVKGCISVLDAILNGSPFDLLRCSAHIILHWYPSTRHQKSEKGGLVYSLSHYILITDAKYAKNLLPLSAQRWKFSAPVEPRLYSCHLSHISTLEPYCCAVNQNMVVTQDVCDVAKAVYINQSVSSKVNAIYLCS